MPIARVPDFPVAGILPVFVHRHQLQRLVAPAVVEIREPAAIAELHEIAAGIVNAIGVFRPCSRRDRKEGVSVCEAVPEPQPVFLDQGKHVLVFDRVHASDDEKSLVRFKDPREKLAEEGERRIRDDHVRFVAETLHLVAAEVAVAVEILPLQIVQIDPPAAVGVVVEDENLAVHARLRFVELRRFRFE